MTGKIVPLTGQEALASIPKVKLDDPTRRSEPSIDSNPPQEVGENDRGEHETATQNVVKPKPTATSARRTAKSPTRTQASGGHSRAGVPKNYSAPAALISALHETSAKLEISSSALVNHLFGATLEDVVALSEYVPNYLEWRETIERNDRVPQKFSVVVPLETDERIERYSSALKANAAPSQRIGQSAIVASILHAHLIDSDEQALINLIAEQKTSELDQLRARLLEQS